MKKVVLNILKEECKNTCPIPLVLIPNLKKGITKIQYNEKTKLSEVYYDNKTLTEKSVVKLIEKIGYKIKK